MSPNQMVESYKFWDVVALWANERLEHPSIVARALARGVIVDGLRLQSVDLRWLNQDQSLRGAPYVGYAADPDKPPVLLKAGSLEHLLAVVRSAAEPSTKKLSAEFVSRADFQDWLEASHQSLPNFWFSESVRVA